MKKSDPRIYKNKENIEPHKVCEFWESRAKNTFSNKGVLLGEGLGKKSGDIRNSKEKHILKSLLKMDKKIKILDIGCGIGRWVNNLKSEIDIYHGIDFSENFVNKACVAFNNLNNVNFFLMSATDINQDVLLKKYDLIIMNGVCMYIK